MSFTPWTRGIHSNNLWIDPLDAARIDRFNSRLPKGDGRRIHYATPKGRPMCPGQWNGNPWEASILLLLLNPGYRADIDTVYDNAEFLKRQVNAAAGRWDHEYPNHMLHPLGRKLEPWYSCIPFAELHRHLKSQGMESEDAWRRISQRCAILELSPWASSKWSSGAICSTTPLSIRLASEAMHDTNRIVLLGRGEDDWKSAGLLDADTLPKSLGVRINQSRITPKNFPRTWKDIISKLE